MSERQSQGNAPAATRKGSILPLLTGVALLVFGTNLQGVILPILAHERGSGMVAIGLFSSTWSLGFIVASAAFGLILSRLGHVRAFVALALGSSACALLFPFMSSDTAWIALRLFSGFCYGGAAAIIEAWVLERAQSGAAFAQYMIANLLASLCGTLSLNVVRPDGSAPFLLAGGALALSLVPVVAGRVTAPVMPHPFRPHLGLLLRQSPLGVVGCLFAGLATGALGGLGPVFGMMAGLDMRGDTLMLAANSVGGALAYAPIAFLSERFGRRTLIGALAGGGAAVCLSIVLFASSGGPAILVALLFLFGIAQYPLYGLSVGLACEQSRDRPVPSVSSEALLVFGTGTIAGPMLGGQIMRHGAENLFVMIGALLIALLVLTLMTHHRRRGGPAAIVPAEGPAG